MVGLQASPPKAKPSSSIVKAYFQPAMPKLPMKYWLEFLVGGKRIVKGHEMQQIPTITGIKQMPRNVAVKLGDGTIISLSDLPPKDTIRWVASNKAAVVKVFLVGLIQRSEILMRYDLSDEEFESWINRYLSGGMQALKVTKVPRAADRN